MQVANGLINFIDLRLLALQLRLLPLKILLQLQRLSAPLLNLGLLGLGSLQRRSQLLCFLLLLGQLLI